MRQITCNEENRPCFLTIQSSEKSIQGEKNYIDIAMNFHVREAWFQFMQNRRYLPFSTNGETLLKIPFAKDGVGAKQVMLLDPDSIAPPSRPVIRSGKKIALLQILVQRQ
jgi:hypothetical protein